jgi:hypothetical protein
MTDPDPALLYFRYIVEPTVAEFMADKADRRRGVLAALALASMTEHFFLARPALLGSDRKALDTFKEKIRQPPTGNGAVGLIADVANATKHVVRVPRGASVRPGFEDVRVANIGAVGIMRVGGQ